MMANIKTTFGKLLKSPSSSFFKKCPKFCQVRKLHELIPIPEDLKRPNSLYPNTSMNLIEKEMEFLTKKLNNLTRGTVYEYDSLYKTIIRSAPEPYDSVIFNTSSQLWNLGFFVQQLSNEPVELKSDLQLKLCKSFGSMKSFQNQLIDSAKTIFGNGWVWVIEDHNGELKICSTMNAGTPLVPGRMQQTEGASYGESLVIQRQRKLPPGNLAPGANIPIMAINLWQTGYVADHGFFVEDYVTHFLNHVNWILIRSRVLPNLI
ncbi:hypothetical protein DSO57_1020036 [Entomophthora muscae]|uniref:Uncharacterized protein n=1 Tax=Entomophthora muscae TaxID=34485 RepID=A0ACC2RIL1_9FUNG|nr:hypothetical protein DSO57_1020036 [Entomophthora muscae]